MGVQLLSCGRGGWLGGWGGALEGGVVFVCWGAEYMKGSGGGGERRFVAGGAILI